MALMAKHCRPEQLCMEIRLEDMVRKKELALESHGQILAQKDAATD